MMPGQDYFIMIAKALDIRKSHTVVVYDCQKGWFANRGAFMLKTFGHPDVHVLDGGLQKWKAEGKPVLGSKTVARGEDFAYVFHPENIRNFDDIKAISDDGSAQIVDSRPAAGF